MGERLKVLVALKPRLKRKGRVTATAKHLSVLQPLLKDLSLVVVVCLRRLSHHIPSILRATDGRGRTDGRTDGRTEGCEGRRTAEGRKAILGGDTDAVKSGTQIDGPTDGWADGRTVGRQRQTVCVMIWHANQPWIGHPF